VRSQRRGNPEILLFGFILESEFVLTSKSLVKFSGLPRRWLRTLLAMTENKSAIALYL
jgi:hypothetical protein